MSAKHLNYVSTEGPGWTFDAEIGSNDPVAVRKISGPRSSWMRDCPQMGSGHPELYGFILRRISIGGDVGETVEGVLTYGPKDWSVSYPGRAGGSKQVKRYSVEISTNEESILAHPRYNELEEKELIALKALIDGSLTKESGGDWSADIESDRGTECLGKIRKGVVSYLDPGIVWVERFTDKSLSGLQLDKVGNIMNPPGGAPSGGDRNYIYTGATAEMSDDGEQFNIDRRWRLSGRKGWDPQLYSGADD